MNTTRSFCNQCAEDRSHTILHSEKESGSEEEHGCHWTIKHEMLKCQGCGTISLRRTADHSESLDKYGRPEPSISHFPPAVFRRQPEWLSELSRHSPFDADREFITDLIHEVYICIQNDCRRSAAMAVRALLEQVMIDKVGDQGTFAKNIAEFQAKGFISAIQQEFLQTAIEAGHATMHRTFKPSKRELNALVNIAESVVESTYINEHRAAELKKRIPPKKP